MQLEVTRNKNQTHCMYVITKSECLKIFTFKMSQNLQQNVAIYGSLPVEGDDEFQEVVRSAVTKQSRCGTTVLIVTLIATISAFLGFMIYRYEYASIFNRHRRVYYVYAIRHGEMKYQPLHSCVPPQNPKLPKSIGTCPDGSDNKCGAEYLIETGLARARCIAKNINFNRLEYIFAQTPGKCIDYGKVKREYQTVYPLALRKNLTINTEFRRGDEQEVVNFVTHNVNVKLNLCNQNYNESIGSVLYAWDHDNIPFILGAFGCRSSICKKPIPDDEYDAIFKLTLDCKTDAFLSVSRTRQNCNNYPY